MGVIWEVHLSFSTDEFYLLEMYSKYTPLVAEKPVSFK